MRPAPKRQAIYVPGTLPQSYEKPRKLLTTGALRGEADTEHTTRSTVPFVSDTSFLNHKTDRLPESDAGTLRSFPQPLTNQRRITPLFHLYIQRAKVNTDGETSRESLTTSLALRTTKKRPSQPASTTPLQPCLPAPFEKYHPRPPTQQYVSEISTTRCEAGIGKTATHTRTRTAHSHILANTTTSHHQIENYRVSELSKS